MVEIEVEIAKKVEKALPKAIYRKFESELKSIKRVATDAFDDLLGADSVDDRSLAHPSIYYGLFEERLDDFKYYDADAKGVSVEVPDMENFDFSGHLVILQVLEGVVGNYLELPESELAVILDSANVDEGVKVAVQALPGVVDEEIDPALRFRLIPMESQLAKTIEYALGKKLIEFPYSNFEPQDLFETTDKYVGKRISGWIDESIEDAIKEVK